MKKITCVVLIAILLFSCQGETQYNTVKVKSYSLELPSDMVRATNLNDAASLQYQDTFDDLYVIAFEESRKDFEAPLISGNPAGIEAYFEAAKANIESAVSYAEIAAVKKTTINGLPAWTFSVTGIVDDYKAYYEFAVLQGKEKYYRIVVWTSKDNEEDSKDKMKKIIASFKENRKRG